MIALSFGYSIDRWGNLIAPERLYVKEQEWLEAVRELGYELIECPECSGPGLDAGLFRECLDPGCSKVWTRDSVEDEWAEVPIEEE